MKLTEAELNELLKDRPLRLVIQGLGNIPALKNSFHAIIKPENRDWKKRCVQSFVSQLLSSIQTTGSETRTPPSPQSLIASLPHDDRWQIIGETHVYCEKVKPGLEGAEIIIERIYE